MHHLRLHEKEMPECHRCGWQLYLTVEAPHPDMPGRRLHSICAVCDIGNPAARDLLNFFNMYGFDPPAEHAGLSIRLVNEWIKAYPRLDENAFEEEMMAWQAGEM